MSSIKLIKTIKGSYLEHLNTYKISSLFNKPLKSYVSICFATFYTKSNCHTFASVETSKTIKLIEPIFKSFHKNILLTQIPLPHHWPSLENPLNQIYYGVRLANFSKLLWRYCNYYKFSKRSICNTSFTEINTLLPTFKEFWNFGISDQLIVYLKEWIMINGEKFPIIKTMNLVTQNQHFRKGNCSQKLSASKRRSSEKVAVRKKFLLQKSTCYE